MKIKVFKENERYSPNGNITTFIKKGKKGYAGFGEVYFSRIKPKKIKGWKKHKKMTMNLLVIKGKVKFVFFNENTKKFFSKILDEKKPQRLFVKPGLWFAFESISKEISIIANFSNIKHNKKEVLNKRLNEIDFSW